MRDLLELFVKVGSVTLTEFARLTPEDQVTLVELARVERVKFLAEVALAMGNPRMAAEVMSEIDGGTTRQKVEILEAMKDG